MNSSTMREHSRARNSCSAVIAALQILITGKIFSSFSISAIFPCVSFTLPLISLLRYQYDGNARTSAIEVDINSKQLPGIRFKYNQNLGVLESINDLRVYRNSFNRSVMQDNAKQYFTITECDSHGRIKSILINIKSFDVFR